MNQSDRRTLVQDMLMHIKLKTGMNNEGIAKKMRYNSSYLSRIINEGVTDVFYKKLNSIFEKELQDFKTMQVNFAQQIQKPDKYEQALLKTLLTDYIKFKSQMTNKSVEDIADEIDQNTKLTLRDLNKI